MKIAHLLSLSALVLSISSFACTVTQQPAPAAPDSSAPVVVEPSTQPAGTPADIDPPPTPPASPATPVAEPVPTTPPVAEPSPTLPATAGAPCDDKGCAAPFKCTKYYGVAGPRGPEFRSCEITCSDPKSVCPKGTACTTMADGPGRVCRAAAPKPAPEPAANLPASSGAPCDDKGCASPYQCVKYYGIAGPRGPEFKSCEIPCADAKAVCPEGTACTTIADGPGRVCRAGEAKGKKSK
jgi:hypothetical protein